MRPVISIATALTTVACAIALVSGFRNQAFSQTAHRSRPNDSHTAHKSGKPKIPSASIQRGKVLFLANQCLDCHLVGGKGCNDGVVLDGIGKRRTKKFLQEQLKDPEEHVLRRAKDFGFDPNLMTNPNLSKAEINDVVAYLLTLPAAKSQKSSKGKTSHH